MSISESHRCADDGFIWDPQDSFPFLMEFEDIVSPGVLKDMGDVTWNNTVNAIHWWIYYGVWFNKHWTIPNKTRKICILRIWKQYNPLLGSLVPLRIVPLKCLNGSIMNKLCGSL